MKKILKGILAILLVSSVTYAAVNLNITSGQPITEEIWTEVINKVTTLEGQVSTLQTENTTLTNKIATMQGEIDSLEAASGDIVHLLDSKDVPSSWTAWTISNVVPYKPVTLSVKGFTGSKSAQVRYYVTSGTENAYGYSGSYYWLGMSTGKYMTSSDVLIPDETGTITLYIYASSPDTVYAYQ